MLLAACCIRVRSLLVSVFAACSLSTRLPGGGSRTTGCALCSDLTAEARLEVLHGLVVLASDTTAARDVLRDSNAHRDTLTLERFELRKSLKQAADAKAAAKAESKAASAAAAPAPAVKAVAAAAAKPPARKAAAGGGGGGGAAAAAGARAQAAALAELTEAAAAQGRLKARLAELDAQVCYTQ